MRRLACELAALLHSREPKAMEALLRRLLSKPGASLLAAPLLSPESDALEVIALLDGHIDLLGLEAPLLRHALPTGALGLAEALARQVAGDAAGINPSPLEMQILSKGLQLTLALGLPDERVLALLSDATPIRGPAHAGATAGGATPCLRRGELLASRFRPVLLPHLAARMLG